LLTKASNETIHLIRECVESCDKPGYKAIGDTCNSPEIIEEWFSITFYFSLVSSIIYVLAIIVMLLFHNATERVFWIFHAVVIATFASFSVLLWRRLIYQTEDSDGFNDGIILVAAIVCTFLTLIAICFTILLRNWMKSIVLIFRQVGPIWWDVPAMMLVPFMVSLC